MSGKTNMICIYSQNVRKNYVLLDSLLESQKDLYDILFIQEPPQNFIHSAPFTTASGGDEVVGAPIHPDWTQVVRSPQSSEQIPRVICFIHSRLSRLCFALRRNIVDHRDIQLLSFFNRGRCQFLMNIYSDNLHTAMDFLAKEAPNIPHLLYMGGDFNVRDAEQNLFFFFKSSICYMVLNCSPWQTIYYKQSTVFEASEDRNPLHRQRDIIRVNRDQREI